jgi:hypothetical protein
METYTGSAWSTSDLPATGASGNFLQSNGTSWTSASTLAVSNGGTGQTTLTTAYGVLAAGTTATGAVQNIGTGTAAQVLTSNGPGVLPSFQAAGGGVYQAQIFTAPGTWTKPSSATTVKVMVVGGGAGSPGGASACGGTGGIATAYVSGLTGPVAITVGSGGNVGVSGGTSSFGAFVSATGGAIGNSHGAGTVTTGTAFATGSIASFNNVSTIAINGTGITANIAGLAFGSMARNLFNNTPGTPYVVGGGYLPGAGGNIQNSQPTPNCGGVGGAVIVEFVG